MTTQRLKARTSRAATAVLALALGATVSLRADVRADDAPQPPQAELGITAKVNVTPEEQVAQADAIARRGNSLAQRLTKMLGEARKEKDIMRANCVNRKLTEVNANVRNVDSRAASFKSAVKAGQADLSSHEYTVLTVLSQKFDVLDQEAAQCLGQSVFEPGASQVVTTVPNAVNVLVDPSSVPESPPTAPPFFAPASCTSCTQ